MTQIPPQLLDSFHYPEEYMGALRITMMAADIRKCFKLIFEDDTFRLVDLFNPSEYIYVFSDLCVFCFTNGWPSWWVLVVDPSHLLFRQVFIAVPFCLTHDAP